MVYPFNVMDYIRNESARQRAEIDPMFDAYAKVVAYSGPLTKGLIISLGNCFGFDGYRTTPVTFDSGHLATNASTIPGAMTRLVYAAPDKGRINDDWFSWVKSFLYIHPFQDGNGRIASLLFNWGMHTLDEPIPLPYYEF